MGYKNELGMPNFDEAENQIYGFKNYERCYFCGGAIDDHGQWVYWSGADSVRGGGGVVYLHPKCAIELGEHLVKDGFLAERKRVGRPIKIERPDKRARLIIGDLKTLGE